MESSISKTFYDAGQELAAAGVSNIADLLNRLLNRLLCWPFRAIAGFITDSYGQRTDAFGTLIYTTRISSSVSDPIEVPADAVACVIDVSDTLDVERLNSAYERIASVKKLQKTPLPNIEGVPVTNITLGIIFAIDIVVPVEKLTEELDRLNRQYPNGKWPDMVVVLSKGITINYAVQFPGEHVSGDFLPPAEGATASFIPPIYVHMLMKPTGAFTFNKMCAFLLAHLAIFSPGANLPNWADVLQDTPKIGITLSGYQYNLSGEIVPVPRQFYSDRFFPMPPLRIEDREGNLLSTLQFLPWQDGGVLLLRGKLPLEGLLVFLGDKGIGHGGIVRLSDAQISYVLPITQADFRDMIGRIQFQTNMVVRSETTQWVIQKFLDEGSSSPFIARLLIGILRLREIVFSDYAEQEEFDNAYNFVNMTLLNTRTTAEEITQILAEHSRKVSHGEIARIHGQVIHIDEPIDKALRKEVESFLNSAVRVLKQGMQDLTKALHADIGFLFKKSGAFAKGLAALEKSDPRLAEYLRESRKWSERLVKSRHAMEHEGWMLPKVGYSHDSGGIRVEEPQISDQSVSEFVKFMMDRLSCFVEEVTAHCLHSLMPEGISITEIPLSQRQLEMPLRFQVTLKDGGMPIWVIAYHQSAFEEA